MRTTEMEQLRELVRVLRAEVAGLEKQRDTATGRVGVLGALRLGVQLCEGGDATWCHADDEIWQQMKNALAPPAETPLLAQMKAASDAVDKWPDSMKAMREIRQRAEEYHTPAETPAPRTTHGMPCPRSLYGGVCGICDANDGKPAETPAPTTTCFLPKCPMPEHQAPVARDASVDTSAEPKHDGGYWDGWYARDQSAVDEIDRLRAELATATKRADEWQQTAHECNQRNEGRKAELEADLAAETKRADDEHKRAAHHRDVWHSFFAANEVNHKALEAVETQPPVPPFPSIAERITAVVNERDVRIAAANAEIARLKEIIGYRDEAITRLRSDCNTLMERVSARDVVISAAGIDQVHHALAISEAATTAKLGRVVAALQEALPYIRGAGCYFGNAGERDLCIGKGSNIDGLRCGACEVLFNIDAILADADSKVADAGNRLAGEYFAALEREHDVVAKHHDVRPGVCGCSLCVCHAAVVDARRGGGR